MGWLLEPYDRVVKINQIAQRFLREKRFSQYPILIGILKSGKIMRKLKSFVIS